MKSVHQEVISRIGALKPGSILFPTDFRGIGTEDAIKKALSRLVRDSQLERLAHGIYFVPKNHPTFGKLYPSLEEVAEAVAEHEHVRIRPTGGFPALT